MTGRTSTRLAWSLGSLSVAAYAGALTLGLLRPSGMALVSPSQSAVLDYVEFFLFPIVGTLVAWKRPANSVGWLILTYSLVGAVQTFCSEYALHGLRIQSGSLPGVDFAAWLGAWLWALYLLLIPLILLHFPNGQLPSHGWRWVRLSFALPLLLIAVSATALAGPQARFLLLDDTQVIPGFEWLTPFVVSTVNMIIVIALASVVSLFVRYRRAGQEQRQQLKWVLVAAAILIATGIWDVFFPEGSLETVHLFASGLAFAAVPVSIGIAVLKYRLYEIDRIINRTLVYGALTAVLLAGYAGGILLLQSILPVPRDSPISVATSTLAMVALFGPLRSRIQKIVNRRFNRTRYHAERTVENFGARLRYETNLDSLAEGLIEVVNRTVQPTQASLWLRSPSSARPKTLPP